MARNKDTVFSEFFFDQLGIRTSGADEAYIIDCVGKLTETMNTKTITKKCRGRIKKSRTKGSDGTVTLEAHFPYQALLDIYSMIQYAEGVYGYGTTSLHKECIITARVLDEDDNVQLRAYPVAVCNTKSTEIDDDAEEVPMSSLEFTVTADDNEMIVYQALEDEVSEEIRDSWMGSFSQDLIAEAA